MNLSQLFDFQNFTPEFAKESANNIIENSKQNLETIYQISEEKRTFDNTLRAYDDILNELGNVASVSFLLFCTSPDEKLRNACNESAQMIEQFSSELVLNEELYKAIRDYANSEEAKNLQGYQQKMLVEVIKDFEENGLALPLEKQTILKEWQAELISLSSEFQKNTSEVNGFLIVSESEIEGLPEDYKKQHLQVNENSEKDIEKDVEKTYKIGLSYPSYSPFMQYSKSDSARKALSIKYLNRAADKNIDVLQKVLILRKKIANLLGFESYAASRHSNLMSKTPETVWNFELDLVEKVREVAKSDYAELLACKNNYAKNSQTYSTLNSWESAYYRNILMQTKYQIDNQIVKKYFETNNVLQGIFTIAEKLFGVQFVEQTNVSIWHESVRFIEVKENGNLIGKVYLDLFPRENKYSHAACFPLVLAKENQIPTLALVCNFPPPNSEKPSLLTHGDVETFFHEFGHALHVLLSTSPVYIYSGTNTKRDFVEVPSQFFEAWAWHYDSLRLFAKHYENGEILPQELFDKMLKAKNLGSGLAAQAQLFYAIYDLTLHDIYNPESTETTTEILKKLQNQYLQFPYLEGTHFQAAFGHLIGYAASYYGYMWAKVYAEDCAAVFEQKGMFDSESGKNFRKSILSKGGTVDEYSQVVEFLGRKPNSEAFLKSLGV